MRSASAGARIRHGFGEDEDIYRGNERHDVVMMNAADAHALGLRCYQPVAVENQT
jgi:hypothetical protein